MGYSVDQFFRGTFCLLQKDLQPVSRDERVVVIGDREIYTLHLLLRRDRGRASLLSLQREFLNVVWRGLPLFAFSSSSCRRHIPLSLSFYALSLFSVPLGDSLSPFPGSPFRDSPDNRQPQSTTPLTRSPLGVYISRAFTQDWTFFVLVPASRGARLSKRLRADKCQYGVRDVW